MKLIKHPFQWLVFLLAWIVVGVPFAQADCGGGAISLSTAAGAPGTTLTVTGRGFIADCNDVVFNGVRRPNEPATRVLIEFVQGNVRTVMGVVDANEKFEISAVVTVPAGATLGAGAIVVQRTRGNWGPTQAAFTVTAKP